MSKISTLLAVASLATLVSCGETFTLSSGTYGVTNLTAESDQCDLLSLYQGQDLAVVVDGENVTIDFAANTEQATGTITDEAFNATRTVPNIDFGGCTVKGTRTFDGNLTANDAFDGTVTVTLDVVSGGTEVCSADNLGFSPPTCTSKMTFSATKK